MGPEWTSMRICTLEWDPAASLWTLYSRDRNDRRRDYQFVDPAPTVAPLLRELGDDPTGIFWG